MFMIAMSVDVGYIYTMQAQLDRAVDAAALERAPAARVEGAALGDLAEARHRAIDLAQRRRPRMDARDRGHEPVGVGMPRRLDHVAHRTDLDLALIPAESINENGLNNCKCFEIKSI